MKQSVFPKSFLLLLTLSMLGSFYSCSNANEEVFDQNIPQLQADERGQTTGSGGSDIRDNCQVTVSNWTFDTSHLVLMPVNGNYDFAIGVLGNSDCDMSVVDGSNCTSKKRYFLGFNSMADIPLSLADFSAIGAFDSNGSSIGFTLDDQNQGIWVEKGDAQINFKWNPASMSAGMVDANAFSTGGICIIDIMTDPNGGNNPAGSTGGTSSNSGNG